MSGFLERMSAAGAPMLCPYCGGDLALDIHAACIERWLDDDEPR
jgi:hypothetical protein